MVESSGDSIQRNQLSSECVVLLLPQPLLTLISHSHTTVLYLARYGSRSIRPLFRVLYVAVRAVTLRSYYTQATALGQPAPSGCTLAEAAAAKSNSHWLAMVVTKCGNASTVTWRTPPDQTNSSVDLPLSTRSLPSINHFESFSLRSTTSTKQSSCIFVSILAHGINLFITSM